MEDWMDIVFLRSFVNRLHDMRRRFFAIPAVVLREEMPAEVRAYTIQSAECYLFGLCEAAAVLARAALERALSDHCSRGEAPSNGLERTFSELLLISRQRQLLPHEDLSDAYKVKEIGNRAAHGEVIAPDEAMSCIQIIRRLIAKLYPTFGA
jgi:Domain of unknown function (DUF4145)